MLKRCQRASILWPDTVAFEAHWAAHCCRNFMKGCQREQFSSVVTVRRMCAQTFARHVMRPTRATCHELLGRRHGVGLARGRYERGSCSLLGAKGIATRNKDATTLRVGALVGSLIRLNKPSKPCLRRVSSWSSTMSTCRHCHSATRAPFSMQQLV